MPQLAPGPYRLTRKRVIETFGGCSFVRFGASEKGKNFGNKATNSFSQSNIKYKILY